MLNKINSSTKQIEDLFVLYEMLSNEKDVETVYMPQKFDLISEKTDENKEFIKSIYECDEIIDQGNGEVIITYQGQKIRGYKLSNI